MSRTCSSAHSKRPGPAVRRLRRRGSRWSPPRSCRPRSPSASRPGRGGGSQRRPWCGAGRCWRTGCEVSPEKAKISTYSDMHSDSHNCIKKATLQASLHVFFLNGLPQILRIFFQKMQRKCCLSQQKEKHCACLKKSLCESTTFSSSSPAPSCLT